MLPARVKTKETFLSEYFQRSHGYMLSRLSDASSGPDQLASGLGRTLDLRN